MKRKLLSLLLALTLALSPSALAAGSGSQSYTRWAGTVKSYLYDNGDGLTRVEYTGDQIQVENYTYDFQPQGEGLTLEPELSIWGGFFAGEEYNFFFFGQNNEEEDDGKEVIRAVRYDKEWNRLDDACLRGANTIHPFAAGSLRCAEYGGYLYVRTCHEMYTSSDGLNHQSNLTFSLREEDMEITDAYYDVMNINLGYVSHSFNQFILADREGTLITLDHGDAYPRALVLLRYPYKAGKEKFVPDYFKAPAVPIELASFPGSIGQNDTGASAGGLAETSNGYVAAYNQSPGGTSGDRNVYLSYVPRDAFSSDGSPRTAQLSQGSDCSTPVLAPLGAEGGYILWTVRNGGQLSYASYAADGSVGEAVPAEGALSDCPPIAVDGKAVWYVTEHDEVTFYTLDDSGVIAHSTALSPEPTPEPTPDDSPLEIVTTGISPAPSGTAYPSVQTVDVDGQAVEFQMYALRDEGGNTTNYIKLRDLAAILDGTAAQFDVSWNAGAIGIQTHRAYASRNGQEGYTPFQGERPYLRGSDATLVDGRSAQLQSFVLQDDAGGGYTYYKLRDLGQVLGVTVDWSAGRGVYLETK